MHKRYLLTLSALVAAVGSAPAGVVGSSAGPAAGSAVDTIPPGAVSELRSEHERLRESFRRLLQAAFAPAATRTDRAGLVLFLRAEILPHARSEELVLYPAVDSLLGTRGYATATMILDHRAVARLVDELGALVGSPNPEAFTRRACALDGLVSSHFAKEEEFILPILRDRMSETELGALFARMSAEREQ